MHLGIFNSDGQQWHDARARLRPVFSRERVSDLECFERHVQNLLPLLEPNGRTVDVHDLFLRYAARICTRSKGAT
jgi:cytochrome P450